MADPQQRGRRLVQRACGTRSSPASSARPTTRRSPTRRTRRWTPPRSAGRSRTCSSTRSGRYQRPGARRRRRDTSGITWADGLTPGRTIPLQRLLRRQAGRLGARHQPPARAGKHLLLTPGVYDIARSIEVRRPEHRGARHRPRHADRGQRRRPRSTSPTCPASSSPASPSTPASRSRRSCCGSASKHGHGLEHADATRPRCPTCTSASAARTSARPTPRWRSTATTCSSTTPGCGAATTASRASPTRRHRAGTPTPAATARSSTATT